MELSCSTSNSQMIRIKSIITSRLLWRWMMMMTLRRYAMTAMHCVEEASSLVVALGEHNIRADIENHQAKVNMMMIVMMKMMMAKMMISLGRRLLWRVWSNERITTQTVSTTMLLFSDWLRWGSSFFSPHDHDHQDHHNNDYGLWQDVDFTSTIVPACLPSTSSQQYTGWQAVVSGSIFIIIFIAITTMSIIIITNTFYAIFFSRLGHDIVRRSNQRRPQRNQ